MSALFVPLDGRITSQNILDIPLDGSEVMEIVSPGNAATGNTYQVSTAVLADFFAATPGVTSIITAGATLGSPYLPTPGVVRVLFNKSVGAASYAQLPLAVSWGSTEGILFKDLKGDAFTNNITIEFTGGELCDGLSTVVIGNDYGWNRIYPVPGGGGWYLGG